MHISGHRAAGTTAPTTHPVPVPSLRWALARRLGFAVPLGLLFGVMLINGLRVNDPGHAATALAGGMGLSFALFLGIIWLVGRRRRTLFAASGGDPEAVGVLLFGAMAPKIGRLGPYRDTTYIRWMWGP